MNNLTLKQRISAVFKGTVAPISNEDKKEIARDRFTFKHASEENLNKSKNKPGLSHILYDPELIAYLEEDHKKLLHLFSTTTTCLKNKDYDGAKYALEDFQDLLRMHVYEENLKLYCGIESMTQHIADLENSESKSMKAEMIKIQRRVSGFINNFLNVGLNTRTADDFLTQWVGIDGNESSRRNSIQSILVKRIDSEEKRLYRIYKNLGESSLTNHKK